MKSLTRSNVPRLSALARRFTDNGSTVEGMARSCVRRQGLLASKPRFFHNTPAMCTIMPYMLADIGEGITECQIMSWSVKPGDTVAQFDLLCEVQSDKASVEITSRFDGTIIKLHYDVDDMAIVGKPLIDIDVDDTCAAEDLVHKTTSVLDLDTNEELAKADMQNRLEIPELKSTVIDIEDQLPEQKDMTPNPEENDRSGRDKLLLSPAVRHMLKLHDIQPSQVQGTGKGGRILKEDVQQFIDPPAATSLAPTVDNVSSTSAFGDRITTLTAIEQQMFKTMTKSLNIPHFLYTHTVNTSPLSSLRRRANTTTGATGSRLTPLPFIMKAISMVFKEFPKVNAHLHTDNTDIGKSTLVLKSAHNFGIAVDTPQGLLVPIIKNVEDHSIVSLAAEISRISDLAKAGKLRPDDFMHGTFIVSNIGSIGGNAVSPVIVSPMVGIVGIGRGKKVLTIDEAHVSEHKTVVQEQTTLSWSADHRVLDGATVARCAEAVARTLEDIELLGITLK